jgi:hypothetical protein
LVIRFAAHKVGHEARRLIEQRHDARLELLGQELLVGADIEDRCGRWSRRWPMMSSKVSVFPLCAAVTTTTRLAAQLAIARVGSIRYGVNAGSRGPRLVHP